MKKTIQSLAVFALLAVGGVAAHAEVQSAEAGFTNTPAQSTLTREQVRDAYLQSRNNGELQLVGGDAYRAQFAYNKTSELGRADVKAAAIASIHNAKRLPGESSVQ